MEVLHGGVGGAEVDEAIPNRPSQCHLSVCLIAHHFEYVAMNT
jgi:hypothetical protein